VGLTHRLQRGVLLPRFPLNCVLRRERRQREGNALSKASTVRLMRSHIAGAFDAGPMNASRGKTRAICRFKCAGKLSARKDIISFDRLSRSNCSAAAAPRRDTSNLGRRKACVRLRSGLYRRKQRHGMAAVQQPVQGSQAALPADLWGLIARATLRFEGDDIQSWERLSLVNRTWRAGLSGACR